jgi:broad specificity phosphatase PhoE
MMADVQSDKIVYFVLHGQSEDNVAPVFQSPDSPLSAVGRAQAARIAARVAKLAFQALLASPYRRAQETAAVIGNLTGKVPEFVELFTEREAHQHQRQTLYRRRRGVASMDTKSLDARHAR